jgi:hypothetical protein
LDTNESFVLKLFQNVNNVLEPAQSFRHQVLDILFSVNGFGLGVGFAAEFQGLEQVVDFLSGTLTNEHFHTFQFGHFGLLVVREMQVVEQHFIRTGGGFELALELVNRNSQKDSQPGCSLRCVIDSSELQLDLVVDPNVAKIFVRLLVGHFWQLHLFIHQTLHQMIHSLHQHIPMHLDLGNDSQHQLILANRV